MRACDHGHESTVLVLYGFEPSAARIRNFDGESCLDLVAPHERLSAELARLLRVAKKQQQLLLQQQQAETKVEFVKPDQVNT